MAIPLQKSSEKLHKNIVGISTQFSCVVLLMSAICVYGKQNITGVNTMYGKLFSQMYDGTLATKGPWQALVTFQQLIILCDKSGIIDMTPESVARRTTIPLEIIKTGIEALEQPDIESRSPELEGRRIVRLSDNRSWGWQIVNHAHYRTMRSQEERTEYMRNYQRQRRADKDVNNFVNNVSKYSQSSKQYADTESNIKPQSLTLPDWLDSSVWESFKKYRGKRFTKHAQELMIKKLQQFYDEGQNICAILENSIANGWSGIFPEKKTVGKQAALETANDAVVQRWLDKNHA